MNKRQRWFKIALWAWVASIPMMLVFAFLGDWEERTFGFLSSPTAVSDPPVIIATRLVGILASLYMFLGWIPVIVLGLMNASGKKR